jgi:glucosamine--fructose-6-phosphate aminotransferase (isomerizing)
MAVNWLRAHALTLADLLADSVTTYEAAVATSLSILAAEKIRWIYLTGCGDSHHAAVAAELAFQQLTGLPCRALPAMHFGRYTAGYLPNDGPGSCLVLAVSVSGQVSRTAEALDMARRAGAAAVAVTANSNGALAREADAVVETPVVPLPGGEAAGVVPGLRSFAASLLALYLCAVHVGESRGRLRQPEAASIRAELAGLPALAAATAAGADGVASRLATEWRGAGDFVFCGAGPNYGTALFSAAKVLEASGDPAVGQELEEWAHLHFFGREPATPTFIIGGGGRDEDRALEIAAAAKTIGRRVAIIAPAGSALADTADKDALLPLAGPVRECLSPLLACLPGALFAAHRAEQLDEPYFRAFGGGRSVEGGGGISRIRDSRRIERPLR